jgi:predicted Rossmann fold flavoprotein
VTEKNRRPTEPGQTPPRKIVVIGGGAAGYFGAIACAERSRNASVLLLEASHQPLDKVRISGGGRCNVTHNCFDPAELIAGYPRGARELRGPLSRFQPRDTVAWFASRGVPLKAEPDGRMFPVTDSSSTVVECLQESARRAGVLTRFGARITEIRRSSGDAQGRFEVALADGEMLFADRVLMATGNAQIGHKMAAALGHTIVPCVPSLFTFKVEDARLKELSGISVPDAELQLKAHGEGFRQRGPLLITHWGLSGPAVLKLSAWGARALAESHYQGELTINWNAQFTVEKLEGLVRKLKLEGGRGTVRVNGIEPIPRRLWTNLTFAAGFPEKLTWADVSRDQITALARELTGGAFHVAGKGIFKDEFVTCGGVSLKEVDFRSMESRVCPGLFFAGEILDIDGITGGFNFQSAWTTGWMAGVSMAAAT